MRIKKLLALLPSLFFIQGVSAHCPLCTGAVIAGAVGAKYLGLDISIVGIFAGAFAISTGLWISRKLKTYFKYQSALIIIASFLLIVFPSLAFVKDVTYVPLFLFGNPGSLFNKVYFINKLLIGSVIGSLASLFAYYLHAHIKLRYGKVLIPYQGVILTVLILVLSSIPVYFIFK
ncbi:MAG: hypothetical protein AABW56_05220 [Nanoarchaeota archaeon]